MSEDATKDAPGGADPEAPEGADAGASALSQEAEWVPNFPRIRALDARWYQFERLLCGVMFLAMALMVMAAVISDIFGTRREWIDVVVLFGAVWLGVRTRTIKEGEKPLDGSRGLIVAIIVTVCVAVAVYAYTERYPGGFVWAQKLALVTMLWVALLGASMATFERAHLALEMGEKLWPRAILHLVKALAHALSTAFCFSLFIISIRLVADQSGWEATIDANEWLPSWIAILIMPYAFGAMAVRFLAQTVTLATKRDKPVSEQVPT